MKWEQYLPSGQMFPKSEAKQSEAKYCIFSFAKRIEKEAKRFLFRFVSL